MTGAANDPVDAFAQGIERALRELRAEVAALAAEHDVLRPEAEERATPAVAPEQLEPPVAVVDDLEPAEAPPARRSRLLRAATAVVTLVCGAAIATLLLATVGPRLLPYQTYFVRSGSMAPAIETGAVVVLQEADAGDLRAGDIITFPSPNDDDVLVTHRIVGVETTEHGRVLVTKGDANPNPDPWRVPAGEAGWKYWFDVPKLGYVFGYLSSTSARLALIAAPAIVLGLRALRDVRRTRRRA